MLKSIRIIQFMSNKKTIFGFFILNFLGACTSPTAMLGPAYTLSSTGNIFQASLSYGSNELVKSYTGKTNIENFRDIINGEIKEEKNVKKDTLQSEEFYILVQNKINKANSILNLSR